MSRRKHVALNMLQQEVEPPGEGEYIVRAVGSRGSNIMEVEYPGGRRTLCLIPAKFHKKVWIKRGTFLIIEDADLPEERVTGQVVSVLYADHVKQLKKVAGLWPSEFGEPGTKAAEEGDTTDASEDADASAPLEDSLQGLSLGNGAAADSAEDDKLAAGAASQGSGVLPTTAEDGNAEETGSESDDGLPPLTRIQNRRVVEYEISDTESED